VNIFLIFLFSSNHDVNVIFSIFKKQQRKFADKHIKEEKSKPNRTRKILISQITTVFYIVVGRGIFIYFGICKFDI
jgi:hypothetical protein